jgi:hypothetical protein
MAVELARGIMNRVRERAIPPAKEREAAEEGER